MRGAALVKMGSLPSLDRSQHFRLTDANAQQGRPGLAVPRHGGEGPVSRLFGHSFKRRVGKEPLAVQTNGL